MGSLSKTKRYVILLTALCMLCLLIVIVINSTLKQRNADAKNILSEKEAVQIIFFRMSGTEKVKAAGTDEYAVDSDFILVGNEGHWGIIDAGHRYENTINDETGTEYSVPMLYSSENGVSDVAGLSSQIEGLNGNDAAVFMHDQLGIDHLDFVIATHAHSDHIGGIPGIAEYSFNDEKNNQKYLVDNETSFFFKEYRHINAKEDDLGTEKDERGYHNQAYFYQAYSAMSDRGAQLIDVSCGGCVHSDTESHNWIFDKTPVWNQADTEGLNVSVERNKLPETDNLSFNVGDLELTLFNLYSHTDISDENANSIVAVVSAYGHNYYFGGDINTENRIEQKVTEAVTAECGTIDLMKMSHHGYNGSNAVDTMDMLQPDTIVVTRYNEPEWERADRITPIIYHCVHEKKYTSDIYESGLSDKAVVVVGKQDSIDVYNLKLRNNKHLIMDDPAQCVNKCIVNDGWFRWDSDLSRKEEPCWYYFKDSRPATGWRRLESAAEKQGDEYNSFYFDQKGIMAVGWRTIDNKEYFFNDGSIEGYPTGCMIKGPQIIDGKEYIFNEEGVLTHQNKGLFNK